MTALAIKTQNFLSRVLNKLIEARQKQAELEVARMLQRDYPAESVEYIATMIRKGKVGELSK